MDTSDNLIEINALASLLDRDGTTVARWVREKNLSVTTIGKRHYVEREVARQWLRARIARAGRGAHIDPERVEAL